MNFVKIVTTTGQIVIVNLNQVAYIAESNGLYFIHFAGNVASVVTKDALWKGNSLLGMKNFEDLE